MKDLVSTIDIRGQVCGYSWWMGAPDAVANPSDCGDKQQNKEELEAKVFFHYGQDQAEDNPDSEKDKAGC